MAEETMSKRLSAEKLRLSYGGAVALDGVDFSVAQGETVAVVGRSGCGKSSLFRCLALMERLSSGTVSLDAQVYIKDGKPTIEPWRLRQEVVMVFQDYCLFPNMTARRNITLALEETKGVPGKEANDRARKIAEQLGIGALLDRYPDSLSGGQAQRLALARAMVLQPKVLLLDEITSGLDPETITDVVNAIEDLRAADASGELSIVLATHLMRFAAGFADRIAFMHSGSIYEEGQAREFFSSCEKPETRRFVSTFGIWA